MMPKTEGREKPRPSAEERESTIMRLLSTASRDTQNEEIIMIKRIFTARLEKHFFRRLASGGEVNVQAKSNRLGEEGSERDVPRI